MTQLASVYHTNKISEETILEVFYSLQKVSFQNTFSKGDNIKMDYKIPLDYRNFATHNLLSCGGFSEEDVKWWLNIEEDLSTQLSSLVKDEKLLKFEGYLGDYQTLVEKYIPTELYCKNHLDFQELFEIKYGDFS
jgi:hypothetical protein